MSVDDILRLSPVRAVTLAIIAVIRFAARAITVARSRALFPNVPDVYVHWTAEIKFPHHITLGQRVVIGQRCTVGAAAPIYIGDDVHFSKGAFVETGYADITSLPPYKVVAKPIRIERGVWLGAGAMVLGGVTIGENSIVAAGTIVRKSVPPNTVVSASRPILQSLEALDRLPR